MFKGVDTRPVIFQIVADVSELGFMIGVAVLEVFHQAAHFDEELERADDSADQRDDDRYDRNDCFDAHPMIALPDS
jgi:hypothetical protein